jgi:hypothetical protein
MTRRLLVAFVVLVASSLAQAKPGAGSTTGVGRVFAPNPVATLQDQTLTDRKDADYAALQPAYRTVSLTNLDGTGKLCGDFVCVTTSTGPLAYSATNTFAYGRSDDRFEQVMAYYWITEAQKYLQALGFGVHLPPVNREPQAVKINQWGVDNSYSWDKHDLMRFGKGGVDDAEDAQVILHEYGHAMMDSMMTPFGYGTSVEAGSVGEGFGDYWAMAVTATLAPTADPACLAAWDSTEYTTKVPHCLRRMDTDLTYPDDLTGEVHHDGLIWSRALFDLRNAVDPAVADTVVVASIFAYTPDTSMVAAAQAVVDTAADLFGADVAAAAQAAFAARGLL